MGIIKRGILGGFAGKVANVVGTSWKGIAVMKSLPLSVANPKTAGQVTQRNAFKACSQFASFILASLVVPLMNRFAVQMSGYNMFVQRNVEFFDENGIAVPESINFGTGKLGDTPIQTCQIDISNDGAIITWTSGLDNQFKQNTDIPYGLCVDSETKEVIAQGTDDNLPDRQSGGMQLSLINAPVLGRTYWFYLVFLRADGTIVGNTAYLEGVAVA
jgi:hypothetical protein